MSALFTRLAELHETGHARSDIEIAGDHPPPPGQSVRDAAVLLDPGETPVEAALREANEELGIDPADVRIIGESDLFHTGSGFAITPVIGIVPADLELSPSPTEVAQWFEAPLDYIFDPANQHRGSREINGREVGFWEIRWQEHRIWGVTGALVVNLSRRLGWHD
jgi:hypothetical protein